MANDKKSWFGRLKGSTAELKARQKADAQQREHEGKREGSIILSQNDILTGNWDASKVLFTTIGGQLRPITGEDLAAFRRNIRTAQKKLSGGITAQQVIDWSQGIVQGSSKSDLTRAKEEIKMVVPVSAKKGVVRFITNSGPDSDVSRHHVIVEFLNYGAEAASAASDPRKSALRLRKGPLKIECDCGRWRFWFRYIASIGGYNAGRPETGFPKIRNPKLQGIACKHIVRVMAEVKSGGSALAYLTKLMAKAKADDNAHAELRQTQKNAEQILKNQAKRTTGNDIKTSEQKRREREAKRDKKKLAEALMAHQAKHRKQKVTARNKTEQIAALMASQKIPRSAVEAMFDLGGIKVSRGTTKEQFLRLFDEASERGS